MIELFNVTVHARDPRLLARFWSAALGYPIVADGDSRWSPEVVGCSRSVGRWHEPRRSSMS